MLESWTAVEQTATKEKFLKEEMIAESILKRYLTTEKVQSPSSLNDDDDDGCERLWGVIVTKCMAIDEYELFKIIAQLIKIEIKNTESLKSYRGRVKSLKTRLIERSFEIPEAKR